MLRKTYETQDQIPEGIRDHYTDTGNGWQLQLDADDGPAVDLTRYREMRDNNIKMKAQLEELMTEQQQIRDQYKTMLDKAQGEEEAALLKQGYRVCLADVEKFVQSQTPTQLFKKHPLYQGEQWPRALGTHLRRSH